MGPHSEPHGLTGREALKGEKLEGSEGNGIREDETFLMNEAHNPKFHYSHSTQGTKKSTAK